MSIPVTHWTTALDCSNDGISLLSAEGKVVWWNAAMAHLVGKPLEHSTKYNCYDLIHNLPVRIEGCPFERVKTSLSRESSVVERGEKWFNVIVDPILDESGKFAGAVHTMCDVTSEKRSEESFREKEKIISLVADIGVAITRAKHLKEMLQRCTEIVVEHLGAAFARIWTFDQKDETLVLRASAGTVHSHFRSEFKMIWRA